MSSNDDEPDEEFFDDDDDEEDDFVPGADDEEEDEDEEAEVLPILDGHLSLDEDQKLMYQGEGFRLVSTEKVPWNLLDSAVVKPPHETVSLEMVGPCDVVALNAGAAPESSAPQKKATPRTMRVAWTVADDPSGSFIVASKANLKSSSDDDNDHDEADGKKASSSEKRPALLYQVYGQEVESSSSSNARLEFRGGYHPSTGGTAPVNLVTQVRVVQQATTPPVAAAAAAAAAPNGNSEDEDGDDDAAAVDYDELIALHEDAGLSVDALRKRYRDEPEDEPKKKGKSTPEDDDDDVEF